MQRGRQKYLKYGMIVYPFNLRNRSIRNNHDKKT